MTIYELGVEYAMAAAMLQGRIRQLEELLEQAGDEGERQQLEGRIRPLRVMCRETRAVARHLQGYCRREGVREVTVLTGDDNRTARAFYETLGFSCSGEVHYQQEL